MLLLYVNHSLSRFGEVVEDHRLIRAQGRNQKACDKGGEGGAIQRADELEPGAEAVGGQGRRQRHRLPAPVRDRADDALAVARGQGRRRAGLIEKDQGGGIERRDLIPPDGAGLRILFPGDQRLFLCVSPRSRSQRLIAEREGRAPNAVAHAALSSARVASG